MIMSFLSVPTSTRCFIRVCIIENAAMTMRLIVFVECYYCCFCSENRPNTNERAFFSQSVHRTYLNPSGHNEYEGGVVRSHMTNVTTIRQRLIRNTIDMIINIFRIDSCFISFLLSSKLVNPVNLCYSTHVRTLRIRSAVISTDLEYVRLFDLLSNIYDKSIL
jgi:hypothetical protein